MLGPARDSYLSLGLAAEFVLAPSGGAALPVPWPARTPLTANTVLRSAGAVLFPLSATPQQLPASLRATLDCSAAQQGASASEACLQVDGARGVRLLRLVGLTVRGSGEGSQQQLQRRLGGAVSLRGGATLELDACVIEQHAAGKGAAVFADRLCALRARRTVFARCNASESGGALFLSSAAAELSNCTLTGNRAGGSGGAIALSSSTLTADHLRCEGNVAAGKLSGGGCLQAAASSVLVDASVFERNQAG
jgi:hypothetical protein